MILTKLLGKLNQYLWYFLNLLIVINEFVKERVWMTAGVATAKA